MQRLKHAFRFIRTSLKLAFTTPELMAPLLLLLLGGLGVLLLAALPIALTVGLIGPGTLGLLLTGFFSALGLASLHIWGEMVALQISAAFSEVIQKDKTPEQAQHPIKTHWKDVLVLSLGLPLLQISNGIREIFAKSPPPGADWRETHHLLVPLISLENRDLKDAIKRLQGILDEKLLRFHPRVVQVDLVAQAFILTLTALGLGLGFISGLAIAAPLAASPWRRALGAAIGALVAGLFTLSGLALGKTTRTCYHTALYEWVHNVENARASGDAGRAHPPEILRDILSKK